MGFPVNKIPNVWLPVVASGGIFTEVGAEGREPNKVLEVAGDGGIGEDQGRGTGEELVWVRPAYCRGWKLPL